MFLINVCEETVKKKKKVIQGSLRYDLIRSLSVNHRQI